MGEVATYLKLTLEEAHQLVLSTFGKARDVLNAAEVEALRLSISQQCLDFFDSKNQETANVLFDDAVRLEDLNANQAIDAYFGVVAANPLHADAHVNLGRLLHQRGRLLEAEAHYVAALVSRPQDATALFNRAVVLEDLGRVDEAMTVYRETLALAPVVVDAYFNLARLYEAKGEKVAAIRHLKDYRRLAQL